MEINYENILKKLYTAGLHLHEVVGRVDRDVVANYNNSHKVNHVYTGDESHFLMDNSGDVIFIGNVYCLQGFANNLKSEES